MFVLKGRNFPTNVKPILISTTFHWNSAHVFPTSKSSASLNRGVQFFGRNFHSSKPFRISRDFVSPSTTLMGKKLEAIHCLEAGMITKAELIIDELYGKGDPVSIKTYTRLLYYLGRRTVWPAGGSFNRSVEKYLSQMSSFNIIPNEVTYGTIIVSFARSMDLMNAIRYYKHMLDYNILPSVNTMNSIIAVCGKLGFFDQAEVYYDVLLAHGITPDSSTLTSLVCPLLRKPTPLSIKRALDWLEQLHYSHKIIPDEITCNALIRALAKMDDVESLMKYYHFMETHKIPLERSSLSLVLAVYEKGGNMSRAQQLRTQLEGSSLIFEASSSLSPTQ